MKIEIVFLFLVCHWNLFLSFISIVRGIEPEPEPAPGVFYTDPETGRIWCMREGSVESATWTDLFLF